MPARKPAHRTRRSTKRGTKPQLARLSLAPPLTSHEVRELKARAAADLRTISNYVSFLVVGSLGRKSHGSAGDRRDKRQPYAVQLYLTATERRQLEARAKVERRSLSGYAARVIVAELFR